MNVLVYLVPMALGLGLLGLFAFLWALRSGQYSDVDGAALRVLSDDDVETVGRNAWSHCLRFALSGHVYFCGQRGHPSTAQYRNVR